MEEIGKNIAALRKKAGLTQEELAEQIGISAQAVSKWENAVTMPDILLLPMIAGIFGVTVDTLYGGENMYIKPQYSFDEMPEQIYRSIAQRIDELYAETTVDAEVKSGKMLSYLEENTDASSVTFSENGGVCFLDHAFAIVHRDGRLSTEIHEDRRVSEILALLADADVQRIISYEIEHKSEYLTSTFCAGKLGIPVSHAAERLEKLTDARLNYKDVVKIDPENEITIYMLASDDKMFLALTILAAAGRIAAHNAHYYNYRGSYAAQWLR